MNIFQQIFSVKNEINKNRKYKVITFLGIKIKFRQKSYEIEQQIKSLSKKIEKQKEKIDKYKKKLKNTIYKVNNQGKKFEKLRPVFKYIKWANYQINKDVIDIKIEKFKKRGTIGINETEERTPRLIVSLTTFPERIGDVHYALYSLLNQTVKPDKVILWLASEQFPDGEDDISQKVLDLKNNGLTIEFTEDTKAYKKLVPALKMFPEDIIVTADDDILYPPTWLEQLYNEYLENPNRIYAHRCYKATFDENNNLNPFDKFEKLIDDNSSTILNYPTTGGGVLYPPHSLYSDVTNEALFKQFSRYCDETWFWAMGILNKKEVKVLNNPVNMIAKINVLRDCCFGNETTLARVVNKLTTNEYSYKDEQIRNVLEYYPQAIEILREEFSNIIQAR